MSGTTANENVAPTKLLKYKTWSCSRQTGTLKFSQDLEKLAKNVS